MDRIAGFFGGMALGGLLTAACGFDLFGPELDFRDRYASSQRAVAELVEKLETAKRDRERYAETCRRAEQDASRSAADLTRARDRLTGAVASVPKLEEEVGTLRRELKDVRGGLVDTRVRLAAKTREGELLLCERRRLAEAFFSKPRGMEDRDVAREFLLGHGTLGEKIRSVILLRRYSPELLLALGDLRPLTPDLALRVETPDE